VASRFGQRAQGSTGEGMCLRTSQGIRHPSMLSTSRSYYYSGHVEAMGRGRRLARGRQRVLLPDLPSKITITANRHHNNCCCTCPHTFGVQSLIEYNEAIIKKGLYAIQWLVPITLDLLDLNSQNPCMQYNILGNYYVYLGICS